MIFSTKKVSPVVHSSSPVHRLLTVLRSCMLHNNRVMYATINPLLLSYYWADYGDYIGGLSEERAPLVKNLITKDYIVQLYVSNPQ